MRDCGEVRTDGDEPSGDLARGERDAPARSGVPASMLAPIAVENCAGSKEKRRGGAAATTTPRVLRLVLMVACCRL